MSNQMLLDVTQVTVISPYQLRLSFDNGEERQLDFSEHFPFTGVFSNLKEPEYFKQVQLNSELGTIFWPNGADLCPDVLHELSTPVSLQTSSS